MLHRRFEKTLGTVICRQCKSGGRGRCWRAVPPEDPGNSWARAVSKEMPALCYLRRPRGPPFPWSGKWAEPHIYPDTTGPRESAPWRPLGCLGPTGLKQGADSLFKIKSNKSYSDLRTDSEGLWSLAHCTACISLMSLPTLLCLRGGPLCPGASEWVVRSFLTRLQGKASIVAFPRRKI